MPRLVTTQPAVEPMLKTELKTHLRIASTDFDADMDRLIIAARQRAENYMWRSICTQTIELRLRRFPSGSGEILLPGGPVQSLTSVDYVDTAGGAQSLTVPDDVITEFAIDPATVRPAYDTIWPSTRIHTNAVTIVYQAGYGVAADVPELIKSGIKMMAGAMFENPEGMNSNSYRAGLDLLTDYKITDGRLVAFTQ